MICACCGLEIEGKAHGPYRRLSGVVDYVCDGCWNDPSLSFPDKVTNFLISSSATKNLVTDFVYEFFEGSVGKEGNPMSSGEVLQIDVVRLSQGNITAYVGKMTAANILALYDLKLWSETQLDGYQRQLYEERKKEIAQYLKDCSIPVIPAILVSIRENAKFLPSNENGDTGTLEIPRKRGSIMLIDGQHRMSGFSWYAEELARIGMEKRLGVESKEQKAELETLIRTLKYDVPVLFLDSRGAADVLDKKRDLSSLEKTVLPEDVERVVFYILNKTQKGISPSLRDTLQFLIYRAGISGIPSLEKEKWRVNATEIGHNLNRNESPLAGKINLSGARGLGRPLQLNSWVTSLKPLFTLENFQELSREEKYTFVKVYWSVLRKMFRDSFDDEKSRLLLKSIGVYSLNWLAADIYEWCNTKSIPATQGNISKFLEPLTDFHWRSKEPNASPFRGLGGRAGVSEAYKILLERLAKGGIAEASEKLEELDKEAEARA